MKVSLPIPDVLVLVHHLTQLQERKRRASAAKDNVTTSVYIRCLPVKHISPILSRSAGLPK